MCASHLLNRWLHGASTTGEQEMVQVSLEQIQPFSLNPRVTRNPGYDALKASILARGLDNPPVLTRRPGDEKYMLASGGNTRLAILNELWQETQDERYHRVCWPFRPWPETLSPLQGEVQCLIGHLAESDLHNGLMFIERAEGVLHLRDLYHEAGIECVTQLALAEQLTRDGYPVSQSQISRMLQTVDWLLPCIPNALYGGLTRKVIDRLLALRSAAEQVWAKLMPPERQPEFADLFSTALATFNGEPEAVVPQLVQDELLGEMSCRSGMSWNTLLAELTDGQSKRQALLGPPAEKVLWPPPPELEKIPQPEVEPPTEHVTLDEPKLSPLVHTARSLFASWGLDTCIQPDDSAPAGFTLASCDEFPHPAAQRCYQVLAALNGDTSTPMPALELLLSPDYDNAQIQQLMQLISLCRQRRLREVRHDTLS
ncbi:chromosome partitioning protein ParB [Salmonella enterica]|nr:chromosome partitioning protein ParB [Salmonella enterica]EJH7016151.1 chromosome partitioning protein ParB [Salmonella enterica]EJH7440612.1 chromosome partitioning protein ParB [Salmonella enterica]EJH7879987.1 chromosome partitioning protein ParB [Salmonella enterica]EJI6712736.1 chromosome partitioning protein ParB [Salmonella enterica]